MLGADPVGSYAASAKAAAEVFRRPGALDAPCAVSYGPVPGSVYAGHRFIDVFIHGWDLAAATGQDTTLDPDLIRACRQVAEPQVGAFRDAGALAGPLPVPDDADDRQSRPLRTPAVISGDFVHLFSTGGTQPLTTQLPPVPAG